MVSTSLLLVSAVAGLARAQTIVTSSASSVAATSTVSQIMPPAATQGFNIANVSSTDMCKLHYLSPSRCLHDMP